MKPEGTRLCFWTFPLRHKRHNSVMFELVIMIMIVMSLVGTRLNNTENNETRGYKNRLRELVKPSSLTSNHIFITLTDFAHTTRHTSTAKASPNLS